MEGESSNFLGQLFSDVLSPTSWVDSCQIDPNWFKWQEPSQRQDCTRAVRNLDRESSLTWILSQDSYSRQCSQSIYVALSKDRIPPNPIYYSNNPLQDMFLFGFCENIPKHIVNTCTVPTLYCCFFVTATILYDFLTSFHMLNSGLNMPPSYNYLDKG